MANARPSCGWYGTERAELRFLEVDQVGATLQGIEGFGHVHASDADSGFAVGQPVLIHAGIACGVCEFCQRGDDVLCTRIALVGEHRDGAWSEYLSLPARNVLPAPTYLQPVEAAALGVTHLTAWRMLMTQARLKPGELVGGLYYFNYPGSTGLMANAVFGRMAGREAAAWVKGRKAA